MVKKIGMFFTGRKGKVPTLLFALFLFWLPDGALGSPQTILLPVTLDYPFIRSVFIQQLYNAPKERAVVIDEIQGGCSRIELWNPEVGHEKSLVRLGSRIRIRSGAPILDRCVGQFEWEGYIEVLQRVTLDTRTWRIRLETVDSRVYNRERKPAIITGTLWNLIKNHVHPFLEDVSINLWSPIEEIKAFLPLLFAPEERRLVDRWFETLTPGPVRVEESAIKVDIALEVEPFSKPREPEAELSVAELERLSQVWEQWDAFLVLEIESLIGQSITEAERMNILEILLENRHEFIEALENRTIDRNFIRRQYVWTSERLTGILRKYLIKQKNLSALQYLTFFTASDALAALDKLAPALGWEINRDGLVRLARMLSAGEGDPALLYSYSVDPVLRKFLGLGPALDEFGPASDVQELELPAEPDAVSGQDDRQSWLNRFLFPRAWAAEGTPSLLDRVKEWIPPARNPERYMNKVRTLLKKTTDKILSERPLPKEHHSFFHLLVLATAWQESCWRQFVTEADKIRYLISYNGSSVGLMQVNQRVWRGIYRVESLRWNIRYNVEAGIEILELYLRTYVLKNLNPGDPFDRDAIARAAYAVYNQGPGRFKKTVKQGSPHPYNRIDRLFREKYFWVKEDNFQSLVHCITGQ